MTTDAQVLEFCDLMRGGTLLNDDGRPPERVMLLGPSGGSSNHMMTRPASQSETLGSPTLSFYEIGGDLSQGQRGRLVLAYSHKLPLWLRYFRETDHSLEEQCFAVSVSLWGAQRRVTVYRTPRLGSLGSGSRRTPRVSGELVLHIAEGSICTLARDEVVGWMDWSSDLYLALVADALLLSDSQVMKTIPAADPKDFLMRSMRTCLANAANNMPEIFEPERKFHREAMHEELVAVATHIRTRRRRIIDTLPN